MKVFMLNEYEWWAAETLEEAISACIEQEGISRNEAYDESYARELSDEAMESTKFYDDDGNVFTFKERLEAMIEAGCSFPCPFASTEF